MEKLQEYRDKRDFEVTSEPAGDWMQPSPAHPRFVVQKHDASHLHYDLRIEAGGVLKSWAVPKGPSLDPADKRLAMPTEDHPLEYLGFEGVIPRGQYGGGTMIVWDVGYYRNLGKTPIEQAVQRGHLKIWLTGKKLRGGFALTRTGADDGREKWILVKMSDEEAAPGRDVVNEDPGSVLTGRTTEEVFAEEGWSG